MVSINEESLMKIIAETVKAAIEGKDRADKNNQQKPTLDERFVRRVQQFDGSDSSWKE